jgi:hypothetical protein
MDKSEIKEQHTYRSANGRVDLYVQAIEGQRVTFVHVGEVERHTASLGRFASMVRQQIPNR